MTEYFTKNHPCIVTGVLVVVSIIIRVIGIVADAFPVTLAGDIIFVGAILLGIVGLVLRRRARGKAIGFCEKCGEPYLTEDMQREHAASHP